jgi:hypothetical protein
MKRKKISIVLSCTLLTTVLNAFNNSSIKDLTTDTTSSRSEIIEKKKNIPIVNLDYYQLALDKANIKINLSNNSFYFTQTLLSIIQKNLMFLKLSNIEEMEAKKINISFILKTLKSFNIENFDNDVSEECKDDKKCINETLNLLSSSLLLDKKKIDAIIPKKDTVSVNIENFSCQAGEIKTIQQYGVKDLFSTANGSEPAHPHPVTALIPSFVTYNNNHNAGFSNYDNSQVNRQFLENIHNLPANINSGRFYISLKSNGTSLQSNDGLVIGDIVAINRYYQGGSQFFSDLASDGWVQFTNANIHTFWNDFSNILFQNGTTTLLQHVANNNHFDVYIQDDTSVDYITVVTCSQPTPIQTITTIVNNFECSEHERLIKILGGEIDAFSQITDTPPANPANHLTSLVSYPTTGYDETHADRHFLETLYLPTTMHNITKAELNIGYRPLNNVLQHNDGLNVGHYNTNYASGKLSPTATNSILTQGWNIHNISNGEKVIQANLADVNNSTGTGNLFSTALSTGHIDIYVQDDTAIDFTQLNLCVKKCHVIAPGDYIGVSSIKDSNTSVRIGFKDNSANEDGFRIFGSGINENIPSNDETKHAYVYKTISGLTCNKTYSIQAVAYKGNNVSLPTSVRSFNIHTTFALPCN